MDVTDLLRTLRPHLAGALIATDFDGTLAPLVTDPEDSCALPGTIEALSALHDLGAHVAIVTGRDAATVVRLGEFDRVPGLTVAGLYGVETWVSGRLTSPPTPPDVEALRARLPGVLAAAGAHPDVWIEDKRLSLVVHARRVPHPEQALAQIQDAVAQLADELGLELHPGSGVLELRLPGYDKGGAIGRLVEQVSPTAVLYLGDDLGDVPAFTLMRRLRDGGLPAWGVAVTSSGVPAAAEAADVPVPDAEAAVALLTALGGSPG